MFPNYQVIVYVSISDAIKHEHVRVKKCIDTFKETFDINLPNPIYLPTFHGDTRIEVISY